MGEKYYKGKRLEILTDFGKKGPEWQESLARQKFIWKINNKILLN